MKLQHLPIYGGFACATLLFGGCATKAVMPFQLIDEHEKAHRGALRPAEQHIEVVIDGVRYEGFYLPYSGVVNSTGWPAWRSYPYQTSSSFNSNYARSSLRSVDGRYLSCEFIAEGTRAAGECKTAAGRSYQFVGE